jgi:hypothetical protein
MSEKRPIKVKLHVTMEMSDGSIEELIVPELDMTRLGSGLTTRLIKDLRAEGVVVEAKQPVGETVPGMVFAVRGALVEQADGELYTQRRTEDGAPVTVVAGPDGPRGPN